MLHLNYVHNSHGHSILQLKNYMFKSEPYFNASTFSYVYIYSYLNFVIRNFGILYFIILYKRLCIGQYIA